MGEVSPGPVADPDRKGTRGIQRLALGLFERRDRSSVAAAPTGGLPDAPHGYGASLHDRFA